MPGRCATGPKGSRRGARREWGNDRDGETGGMSDDYDWTPHLREGEEVLWQGRPDGRGVIPRWFDLWALLFLSVIYTIMLPLAVNLGSETGDWRMGFLLMIGIMIALFLRLVVEPAMRRRQSYCVTQERALIVIDGKTHKLQQFQLRPDSHVWRSGWRYPMVAFSRRKPGFFSAMEPFIRMDGPPMSPVGGGLRGAEMTFLVPDDPNGVVEMARKAGANRTS